MLGRFGGEEFLLILRDRGAREATVVAEGIRRLVAEHDFTRGGTQPLGGIPTASGSPARRPARRLATRAGADTMGPG